MSPLQSAVLVGAALFLNGHLQTLETSLRRVHAEVARHPWLKNAKETQLEDEKKDLDLKVQAIHGFLSTRVLWTSYTQDASERLPEQIILRSFSGQNELASGAKTKGTMKVKKSLMMRMAAPIASGGTVPKEIDGYIDILRANPLLKRDFPIIELGDLKWNQSASQKEALADFTVVCLPKIDKAAAKAKAQPGKAGPHR